MADDPESKGSALVQISDLFGLSKPADRLVAAIVRGVGNFLAPTQKKRQTKVDVAALASWDKAFQKAGISIRSANLTIEDRTTLRVTAEEIRHQENREFIAIEAAQEYKNDPTLHNMSNENDGIEVEWLDRFWRLAQDVTDNEMQSVWGRVLARQASGHEKYSARCLEALSLLSRREAVLLEKLAPFLSKTIINGQAQFHIVRSMYQPVSPTYFSSRDNDISRELSERLQKSIPELHGEIFGPAGIFLDSGSGFAQEFYVEMSTGEFKWWIANTEFLLTSKEQKESKVRLAGTLGVSPQGGEIFSLIKSTPDASYLTALRDALRFRGFELEARH